MPAAWRRSSFLAALVERLADVAFADSLLSGQVGDRPREAETAIPAARAQPQMAMPGLEGRSGGGVEVAVAAQLARGHLGIGPPRPQPLRLDLPGSGDSLPDRR